MGSKFIWIGLAIPTDATPFESAGNGVVSDAKRLTSNPSARMKDFRSISGSGSGIENGAR